MVKRRKAEERPETNSELEALAQKIVDDVLDGGGKSPSLAEALGGAAPAPEAASAPQGNPDEGKRLIELLVKAEAVELASEPTLEELAALAGAVEMRAPVKKRSAAVWDWLMESDCVDDVFCDEEDITKLVRQW